MRWLLRRVPWFVWLAGASGALVVGFAVSMVQPLAYWSTAPSMSRLVVPGWADLHLPAGSYTLNVEAVGGHAEVVREADAAVGLSCRVSDPAATTITATTLSDGLTYGMGGHSGLPRLVFRTATAGRHRLTCDYGDEPGPSVVLAVQRVAVPEPVMWSAILAGALTGAGVVNLLARRHRRRPAGTQPTSDIRSTHVVVVLATAGLLAAGGAAMVLVPAQEPQGTSVRAAHVSAPRAWRTGGRASRTLVPTTVPVHAVRLGDCLDRGTPSVGRVPWVPCRQPHDFEVFAILDLAGGPWPGSQVIEDRAYRLCSVAARGFIGIPAEQSRLRLTTFDPTEGGWNSGDRAVICAAFQPDQKSVGTLRGSRR